MKLVVKSTGRSFKDQMVSLNVKISAPVPVDAYTPVYRLFVHFNKIYLHMAVDRALERDLA